jgi:hypothetical protein
MSRSRLAPPPFPAGRASGCKLLGELSDDLPPLSVGGELQALRQGSFDDPGERFRIEGRGVQGIVQRIVHGVAFRNVTQRSGAQTGG